MNKINDRKKTRWEVEASTEREYPILPWGNDLHEEVDLFNLTPEEYLEYEAFREKAPKMPLKKAMQAFFGVK